jgi:tripartite-type tricarboxylate transporter receptor subunit TctC
MFQQQMGLPAWTDVPYSGSAKAVTDLLGGHVDAMFSMVVPLVPHVAGGGLRLVAVTTRARSPALPAVPTVAETTTLKDFDVVNWTALLAPAGTPQPVIDRLARETAAALHDPAFLHRLETLGLDPAGDGPEALAREVLRTVAQWRDVVRQSGLPVN